MHSISHNKKILILCERSGVVRDAFIERGFNAISCDLVDTSQPGPHIIGDAIQVLYSQHWDMVIAHPPCTYLSRAGARWSKQPGRAEKAQLALEFVRAIWDAPIEQLAIENPIGSLWRWRKPDQIVEPYHFGDPYKKATCLWLRGLPPLMATLVCQNYLVDWTSIAHRSPVARSRTPIGFARAMAEQW
jgi:hypothetical protein